MIERVTATEAAIQLTRSIKDYYGDIIFYQSGGCCDGSVPLCLPKDDFRIGSNDILLGMLDESPFYIHRAQYEYYKHSKLVLDALPGQGESFSLDSTQSSHYVTKSTLFTPEEYEEVKKLINE